MKEILEKYSTRLVNVSGRNRSLVMKKLYKKRSFDIMRLSDYDENISGNVIEFLTSRNSKTLQISSDPYEWYNDEYKILKEENARAREAAIQKLKIANEDETQELSEEIQNKINEIEKKFDKKLEEYDEKLKRKQEKLVGYSNSIKSLVKEIKNTEKETGRYELYVGYPFVEGYFKDKTFTKAPLFLFPIEAIKKGDEWYLKNMVDLPVVLNKVFLIGYAKFNEEKLAKIETEYNDLADFGDDLIKSTVQKLKDVNIHIGYDESEVTRFKEITKDTVLNYNLGEIVIKNNIVMGHFNIANSIYNDYKEMENGDLSNDLMRKLLLNESNSEASADIEFEEKDKARDIVEKDFYFISDLDYSQEIAVKKAEENSQLVIYGPPGTGKSQTIVNIVSQYLSQGKKVLMVSQKKAALDVIFNRSASINSKMIMFNKDVDKKQFYKTIAGRIENLERKSLNIEELKTMSYIIDERVDKLKELGDVLTKKTSFGLTIQEMYSKPKVVDREDEYMNKFFKDFRKAYPFEEFTYKELVDISDKVLQHEKASKFYRLKNIMGNNKYSLYVKENIDIYDLEDGVEEIEDILENYEDLLNILNSKLKYKALSKEISLNNKTINEVSKKINEEENGDLLIKLTDGSKFSLNYWLNLKKNKAKEVENLKLFEERRKEITKVIEEEVKNIKELTSKFDFLKDLLIIDEVDKIINIFDNKDEILSSLKLILDVLNKYNEISALKGIVNDIKENEIKVLEYMYSKESDFNVAYNLLKTLPLLATQVHIGRLQREFGKEIETINNFDAIRKEISNAMLSKRKAVPKYINQKWDNIALKNKIYNEKMWAKMQRECNKKSKLLHIREFISTFSDCIFDLYPCWLLAPEAVSEVLPLIEGLFDVIIFDEASQMFIESAIPTIYRGKKVIVAGDDKQLRPSSAFSGKYDEEEEEYDLDTAAALEEESLLDLAKYSFDATSLYYHYRSKYDELINFSNYAFYGGKLEVSPNIFKSKDSANKPIERIKVDGTWIDRQNKEEAMEVVSLIKEILNNRKENETIGIITFNITQRELIDDLLEIEAGKDPDFSKKYYAEIDRVENNEDVSLFIKNIENVQGDERDIIIFSTAYAKDARGRMSQNFGSLNQDGGENRLNVAISRAKKKVYVVTSIEPEELSVDNTKNNGPKILKKYLQYVKAVSEGNSEIAEDILYSVCDSSISRNVDIHYDSDFERQVREALLAVGLNVDTQIGVSGYKIDLAVYDENTSKYILGIECDGAAYHSSKSARERDIYRQRYLESRGWNIIRIWSKDWWNDPKKEVEKIVNKVNKLLNGNSDEEIREEHVTYKNMKPSYEISNVKNDLLEGLKDVKDRKVNTDVLGIQDEIVAFLKKNNLKFIDKRNKQGGCLWVVGGKELEKTLGLLEVKGINFTFTVGGGKATDYNPGWFYKE